MERMTVKEVSQLLGVSPQTVRERMKRGIWQIGTISKSRSTGIRTYDIFRPRVEELIGKETR